MFWVFGPCWFIEFSNRGSCTDPCLRKAVNTSACVNLWWPPANSTACQPQQIYFGKWLWSVNSQAVVVSLKANDSLKTLIEIYLCHTNTSGCCLKIHQWQKNEVPYDADHVLKLDLEQEKLVQVLKLFFFRQSATIRCSSWDGWNWRNFQRIFSLGWKCGLGPLKLFQSEPNIFVEILLARQNKAKSPGSTYSNIPLIH